MLRRVLLVAAVVTVLAVPWSTAQAGGGVRIGIGIGYPYWYRPYRPVYVVPAPVYVVPAPIVVAPAPVYVQQVPVAQPVKAPTSAAPVIETAPPPKPVLPQ
jgi:hypothetical protein